MDKNRRVFEKWITEQFSNSAKDKLKHFDIEDGYHDETVHALWIGFCAGVELYPLI